MIKSRGKCHEPPGPGDLLTVLDEAGRQEPGKAKRTYNSEKRQLPLVLHSRRADAERESWQSP